MGGSSAIVIVAVVALVVYSVSVHELGHAYMATWLGDPTPGRHGRLTFNPLVQLHPVYSVLFPILSYYMMGWPLGWAFCPIDPSRFKRPLRDRALTGLAGPVMNYVLALLFIGFLWIPRVAAPGTYNQQIFFWAAFWNILLGTFNLLPFPGLDGYDVIRAVLPLSLRTPLDNFRRMGFLPLFVAILVGPRILYKVWPQVFSLFAHLLPAVRGLPGAA